MANYSDLALPSAEWTEFMTSQGLKPPPPTLSMDQRRDYLNETRAKLHREYFGPPPESQESVSVTDLQIPTGAQSTIPARLYQPSKPGIDIDPSLPLIIHLHSGGWHIGNLETEAPSCEFLCASLSTRSPPGFAVVDVCYSHTPQHRYPTQVDDVYAAVEYLSGCSEPTNGRPSLGLRPRKIILSGTSAGAHVATACTIRELQHVSTRQQNNTNAKSRIDALILTCPTTVYPDMFPYDLLERREITSYTQCATDPMLGVDRARLYWGLFIGDNDAAKDRAEISPLIASEGALSLALWPPTSFYVAGMDCLRDEALLFEEKLRGHGVKTSLKTYRGFPHAFNMLPQLEESRVWREHMMADILSACGLSGP